MATPFHIVFAGGGTAGHLFPALAVARKLAARIPRPRITFAGSGKPLELREVTAAGFDYLAVSGRPLPCRLRDTLSFVVENLAGYLAAGRFLRETQVSAVVGMGGYASGAMGRAAGRQGVPLVLLEQNAVAGRTTRWLANRAEVICLAMEPARSALRCRCPVRLTGNPIRAGFGNRRPTVALGPSAAQLLVLGGSSGAESLNENVPRALYNLRRLLTGWRIVHQSGAAGLEATRRLYDKLGLEAEVVDFIDEIPRVMRASELAVCRCGGTTLAELAVAGVPAVLLPYPHATDDHQRKNAEWFTASGAAVMLDQRELSGRLHNHLAGAISPLLVDPPRRARMSAAIRRLARPQAADEVASIILEVVQGRCGSTLRKAA